MDLVTLSVLEKAILLVIKKVPVLAPPVLVLVLTMHSTLLLHQSNVVVVDQFPNLLRRSKFQM